MHITDKSLAIKIAQQMSDANEVIDHLIIIKKMIKKRGQSIFSDRLWTIIYDANAGVWDLIKLLKKTSKNKVTSITNIIRYIKQESKQYNKTFTIMSNDLSTAKDAQNTLEKDFAASVSHDENTTIVGLKVIGEGLYYKRTLDKDLDKLLQ